MSGHTGPIIFENEYARRQLVEHGEVVTFRGDDRTTGNTWWTDEYGTCKDGDVTVEVIGPVTPGPSSLREYQPLSGFPSTADWIGAIEDLHGAPARGFLYRVTER